jgi:6-pyruvoyltetrahydropterin/6-carboxytetrahydropterin synthase
MFTCTKKFTDFPFAHRQHNHGGHCRFIHGHNWAFEFTFASRERDRNGFVVDFGDLKWIKDFLTDMFDHTLVLNLDDPALGYLKAALVPEQEAVSLAFNTPLLAHPFADIRVVPNAGAEGLADFVFEEINRRILSYTNERVFLVSVTVFEDSKNSATFRNPNVCSHV